MSEADHNPEGEPIDVHTLWLGFDDGEECAISIDLTKSNAAMRQWRRTDQETIEP